MLAVLVFATGATVVQRYLMKPRPCIDSATLDPSHSSACSLPMSYFATRRTGDIQRRLRACVRAFGNSSQQGVGGLSSAVQLVATLAMMFVHSPRLSLVFLATAPAYAVMMYSSARLRPLLDKPGCTVAISLTRSTRSKASRRSSRWARSRRFRELMLGQFNAVSRRRFKTDFADDVVRRRRTDGDVSAHRPLPVGRRGR